jgi:hypothetical protein
LLPQKNNQFNSASHRHHTAQEYSSKYHGENKYTQSLLQKQASLSKSCNVLKSTFQIMS